MSVFDKFFERYSYKFPKGYPDFTNKQDVLILENIFNEIGLFEAGLVSGKMVKNPDRAKAFKTRYDNNQPFLLVKGSEVIFDTKKSDFDFETFKGKLIGKDNKEYKLSDLEKTPEFGGEINTTAITEAAQAMAVALRFLKGSDLTEEDITLENFKKVLSSEDVKVSKKAPDVNTIIQYLNNPKKVSRDWKKSIVNIGNSIASSSQINSSKKYQAHWQDDFVDDIYKAYLKVKGTGNSILSSMQSDKWNPGDIWLSTATGKEFFEEQSQVIEDIDYLNGVMDELFCRGDVIGISLKKTTKEPKVKEFNTKMCSIPKKITYKGFKSSPSAQGAQIMLQMGDEEGILNLRNFDKTRGFSGEIKGKEAAGGKVGIKAMNAILDDKGLSDYKLPSSPSDVEEKIDDKDQDIINKFGGLYAKYLGDDFKEMFNTKDLKWKTSKFYALHVIDAIESNPNIIPDVIRYAVSGTPFSSAFIKVSQ